MELIRFYADLYVRISKRLLDLQLYLYVDESSAKTDKEAPPLRAEAILEARGALETAKNGCENIGLQVSAIHAGELLRALETKYLASTDVEALHKNIERELSCRFYIGISEDRKAAYCEGLKGWEDITRSFPRATEDIEEMNKCWALCRYSAAVFHSLLVVEHGLVELGKLLQVTDPKEGWDASCRKLEEIVKAGRKHTPVGLDFGFLEQINTCIQAMKLAWRNKINHATGKPIVMGGGIAPYVCEDTISATRNFMRRLCEAGIKERSFLEELEP
jgi:hypothetical protein